MSEHRCDDAKTNHKLLEEKRVNFEVTEKDLPEQECLCATLLSKRWTVAYMGLYFGLMSFVYRVNINIALPFMVKTPSPVPQTSVWTGNETFVGYNVSVLSNQSTEHHEKMNDDCPEVSRTLSQSANAEFTWSKQAQCYVLSAFYFGYLFQSPLSWIAGQYGGKNIISISMAISSVLMLLFPVLARSSVYAVIAARVLLGLCSGAALPAWYKLISQWALPHERSRFIAMCWLGHYIGTILGFFSSGFLCANGFDKGWGSVFYVHGMVGVVFNFLWFYLIHDSPSDHPRISPAELKLLTSHTTNVDTERKKRRLAVPWRRMLTYMPVWAIFVSHFLEAYIFYMILTCVPLYMKAVLRFDIQSNGIISSLPFICSAVCLSISSILADNLISRRCLSTTTTRKLLQNIGFLGSSASFLMTGFLSCEQRMWVIVCLCLCMCFDGLGLGAGFTCTPVDIAPRYAPVMFGISNTFATIAGIIAPLIVAELTSNDTVEEWRTVFCVAAGCGVVAAVIFGLFSSSELAPWAADKSVELNVYCDTSGHVVVVNGHLSDDLINPHKELIA